MIKQNPFSLYDFFGYFIPGAIAFYIGVLFLQIDDINSIKSLFEVLRKNEDFQIDRFLFFVIISYSLGHLISFISSITIERYAYWKYNYPSKYLLGYTNKDRLKNTNKHKYFMKGMKRINYLYRVILAIVIFPISVLDYLLGERLSFRNFYTRSLDPLLTSIISHNITRLITKISNTTYKDIRNHDFHRLISHYVYENSKNHQSKLVNYVALYGFLRALTFLSSIFFWCFLFRGKWFYAGITSVVGYIYFMGYMKFYRRYTLEGLMLIAIDPKFRDNKMRMGESNEM